MKIRIQTKVKGEFRDVFNAFDQQLLEKLKPIGVAVHVLRFDGSRKGDFVMLRICPPFFSKGVTWLSEITEHMEKDDHMFFTDEGRSLPWPIKYWRHRHIVKDLQKSESLIVDDIKYSTGNVFLDVLLYPVLYLTFFQRVFVYKKVFV